MQFIKGDMFEWYSIGLFYMHHLNVSFQMSAFFYERSIQSMGYYHHELTLKVLVTTIDAQWEGMGDVGSARYEPALLPPCPTIRVLSYSN